MRGPEAFQSDVKYDTICRVEKLEHQFLSGSKECLLNQHCSLPPIPWSAKVNVFDCLGLYLVSVKTMVNQMTLHCPEQVLHTTRATTGNKVQIMALNIITTWHWPNQQLRRRKAALYHRCRFAFPKETPLSHCREMCVFYSCPYDCFSDNVFSDTGKTEMCTLCVKSLSLLPALCRAECLHKVSLQVCWKGLSDTGVCLDLRKLLSSTLFFVVLGSVYNQTIRFT